MGEANNALVYRNKAEELRLQIHRTRLDNMKQRRRIDKHKRQLLELKPLEAIFSEALEATRIYITVRKRVCHRCKQELEIFFFKPHAFFCHKCKSESSVEHKKRRQEFSSRYRSNPEYKVRRNAQIRQRLKTDPQFKLIKLIRGRIGNFLKLRGFVKLKSTREMLGCDFEFLRSHLESQFIDGMNWGNMGKWHIDHRMPLATAKTSEDIIRLNHYSNLRPMWAIDNLKKGSKVYGEA